MRNCGSRSSHQIPVWGAAAPEAEAALPSDEAGEEPEVEESEELAAELSVGDADAAAPPDEL